VFVLPSTFLATVRASVDLQNSNQPKCCLAVAATWCQELAATIHQRPQVQNPLSKRAWSCGPWTPNQILFSPLSEGEPPDRIQDRSGSSNALVSLLLRSCDAVPICKRHMPFYGLIPRFYRKLQLGGSTYCELADLFSALALWQVLHQWQD